MSYKAKKDFFETDLNLNYIGFTEKDKIDKIVSGESIPYHQDLFNLSKLNLSYFKNEFFQRIALLNLNSFKKQFGTNHEDYNLLLKLNNIAENEIVDSCALEISGKISNEILYWMSGKTINNSSFCENVSIVYNLCLPDGKNYKIYLKNNQDPFKDLDFDNNIELYSSEDLEIVQGFNLLFKKNPVKFFAILTENIEKESEFLQNIYLSSKKYLNNFQKSLTTNIETKLNIIESEIFQKNDFEVINFLKTKIIVLQNEIKNATPDIFKLKKKYLLNFNNENTEEIVLNNLSEFILDNIKKLRLKYQEKIEQKFNTIYGYKPNKIILDFEHMLLDLIQKFNKNKYQKMNKDEDIREKFLDLSSFKNELAKKSVGFLNQQNFYSFTVAQPIIQTTDEQTISENVKIQQENTKSNKEQKQRKLHKYTNLNSKIAMKTISGYMRINIENIEAHFKNFDKLLNNEEQKNYNYVKNILNKKQDILKDLGMEILCCKNDPVKKTELIKQKDKLEESIFDNLIIINNIVKIFCYKNNKNTKIYDNLCSTLINFSDEKIIKYVYVINDEGEIVLTSEELSENPYKNSHIRATHSELAKESFVYAAGEIIVKFSGKDNYKAKITEINNGSGHYRPPAKSSFLAYNMLKNYNFDLSECVVVNTLYRFFKILKNITKIECENNNELLLKNGSSLKENFLEKCIDKLRKIKSCEVDTHKNQLSFDF